MHSRCEGSAVFASGDLHWPKRRITKSVFASGPARPFLLEHDIVVSLPQHTQLLFLRSTRNYLGIMSGTSHLPISPRHLYSRDPQAAHA